MSHAAALQAAARTATAATAQQARAAADRIERGDLTGDQRSALAALVLVAGTTGPAPTPITAAARAAIDRLTHAAPASIPEQGGPA